MKRKLLFAALAAFALQLQGFVCTAEDAPVLSAEQNEGAEPETAAKGVVVEEADFQEVILFDNETCTLRLTGIEPDSESGFVWDICFENKTDQNIMFYFDNGSVNGYMAGVTREGYDEVKGGAQAQDRLIFERASLEENEIDRAAFAEVRMIVLSSEQYNVLVQEDIPVIYTNNGNYEQPAQSSVPEGGTVLAENSDFLMKIKETETVDGQGYAWKVYLENYTDTTMQLDLEGVTVNGLVCDPCWSTTLGGKKKSNETVTWYPYMFEDNGITQATEIEGVLCVSKNLDDIENYSQETFEIHQYPLGEEAAVPFERAMAEGEYTVFDDASCTIIVTGMNQEEYGYTMDLYLENKTDQTLEVVLDSTVVNGNALENAWGVLIADIPGQKGCNAQAYWGLDEFEQSGVHSIEELNSLQAALHLYNYDDWSELLNQEISLFPQTGSESMGEPQE